MKNIVSIIALLLFFLPFSIGQQAVTKQNSPIFFNEFGVSVNRMMLASDNVKNKFGFGAGIYRVHFEESRFNLIFGLEYNYTSAKLKSLMTGGHYLHLQNITYNIHSLTVPVSAQYTLGERVKFHIQLGAFFDATVGSLAKGTMIITGSENGGNTIQEYRQKGIINRPDYGFLGGIGLSIPVSNHHIVLRTIYKFGMSQLVDDFYDRNLKFSIGFGF